MKIVCLKDSSFCMVSPSAYFGTGLYLQGVHQNKGNEGGLVFSRVNRLPEDDTPVPKHVGVDTYHELHFMICILL